MIYHKCIHYIVSTHKIYDKSGKACVTVVKECPFCHSKKESKYYYANGRNES